MRASKKILILAALAIGSPAHADPLPYLRQPTAVSVDLRDLARFAPELLPQAGVIERALAERPELFGLARGERVLSAELLEAPVPGSSLRLAALVRSPGGHYAFRRYELTNDATEARPLDTLPLGETHFEIRVGLLQRKAILEDAAHGLRLILPLEVGAVDPGVRSYGHGRTELMTPEFEGATIGRDTAQAAPAQAMFKGLPYIPLTRANGLVLPIAFHIMMDPAMVRGFESHGCLRLRPDDLRLLYAIVAHGGSRRIPVRVAHQLADADDHPYPLDDTGYKVVVNCARPGEPPRRCVDLSVPGDPLTVLRDVRGRPPFEELMPLDGDAMRPGDFAKLYEDLSLTPERRQWLDDPARQELPWPQQWIDEWLGRQANT